MEGAQTYSKILEEHERKGRQKVDTWPSATLLGRPLGRTLRRLFRRPLGTPFRGPLGKPFGRALGRAGEEHDGDAFCESLSPSRIVAEQ
jgi:hypothetical protein